MWDEILNAEHIAPGMIYSKIAMFAFRRWLSHPISKIGVYKMSNSNKIPLLPILKSMPAWRHLNLPGTWTNRCGITLKKKFAYNLYHILCSTNHLQGHTAIGHLMRAISLARAQPDIGACFLSKSRDKHQSQGRALALHVWDGSLPWGVST